MSTHLSPDEFAKCVVGQGTRVELQHLAECVECSAELDGFSRTISRFRRGLRDRIDNRVAAITAIAAGAPGGARLTLRPATGIPKWGWALVTAAVVVLATVPFLPRSREPHDVIERAAIETNPDALMDAVNLHLSRTVPAPMEPMMALIPNDQSITQSGGVQ